MITGELWFKVPASIKFIFRGRLRRWVGGKDLILHTIGDIGVDGALYKAMEFTGPAIEKLTMESRLALCNMAIEAGAKSGIIAPDGVTERYLKRRAERSYRFYSSDPDARYEKTIEYDASGIEPKVALPHLPENTRNVTDVGNIPIDAGSRTFKLRQGYSRVTGWPAIRGS
jgi:3-isopropylmalate/(R)-2-methylmalate dehydratase large subunit